MELERKIEVAKAHALLDQPFFGSLMCPMSIEEGDEKVSTFGTDGRKIYYNREYAESLSTAITMGVLLHEVCHPAFMHLTRRGIRNHILWNIAGDLAINPVLIDAKVELPDDALFDNRYRNLTADTIYNMILEEEGYWSRDKFHPSKFEQGWVSGEDGEEMRDVGGCGTFDDAVESPSQKGELESEWKQKLVSAAEMCKLRGTVPGAFEDYISDFLNPKVQWEEELYKYATDYITEEYDWKYPMKKFISSGIYLPSLRKKEGLRTVVVAVDTSGSIMGYPKMINQFGGEISKIAEDCDVDETIIVYVDADVANVQTYTQDELPVQLEIGGGGGTAFEPAFEWVEDNSIEPTVLIYLTDMYGSFPEYPPDYPVIWVAFNSNPEYYKDDCTFGDVIEVEANET